MNISTISGATLLAKLEKQERVTSEFCQKFIDAGRGHERMSDIRSNAEALSLEYCVALDLENALRAEKNSRMTYHGKLTPIKATALA